ncbi:MAG: hypothetical protein GX538_03790 [Gammaproteobacteria bacterium]|nr:hypothetical protein [Gammaproteobacteria bacterium]
MPRRSTCRWFAAIAAALLLSACQPDAPGAGPPADADPARPDAGNEYTPGDVEAPAWLNPLSGDLAEVDLQTPGSLGVYVRHLGDGAGSLDMGDDEAWYLGATVRVAVAIAVLEQVDAGNLGLDETIALREADLVDGPGTLRSRPPGEESTIAALLEKSLRDGDTVATDMLIRRVGEVDLNRRVREWIGRGFGQVTTHLQERYAAYGGLHPGVAKLTNTDMIRVQEAGEGEARLDQLAALLDVERDDLAHASLEGVFEEFHATGSNAWPLEMFADMLEQLVTGQLLSPPKACAGCSTTCALRDRPAAASKTDCQAEPTLRRRPGPASSAPARPGCWVPPTPGRPPSSWHASATSESRRMPAGRCKQWAVRSAAPALPEPSPAGLQSVSRRQLMEPRFSRLLDSISRSKPRASR